MVHGSSTAGRLPGSRWAVGRCVAVPSSKAVHRAVPDPPNMCADALSSAVRRTDNGGQDT